MSIAPKRTVCSRAFFQLPFTLAYCRESRYAASLSRVSIPLVEWRVANFALTALQPLVTALKRRVSEGE